ncbi:DnaJ domain protein [Trichuris suis]|nr:DnaJ domain protein [Trichuris suis]
MSSLYDALSCESTSSAEELKRAYRRALLLTHPDRSNGVDSCLFQKVVQAWTVLRDPVSRRAYDCWLREQRLRRKCCLNNGKCTISELLDKRVNQGSVSIDCHCGGCYLLSLTDRQYGSVRCPMGDDSLCALLQELNDTQYIVRVNAENLRKHRAQNNVVFSEIEPFLKEREGWRMNFCSFQGKLVKLVSRILFLKSKVLACCKECNLSSFGGLHLWLEIVNLDQRSVQANDAQLFALCDRCSVKGEDRRRFVRAAQNLRWYTSHWMLNNGTKPKEEPSDADLAWIGFDRFERCSQASKSPQLGASEGMVDSGRLPPNGGDQGGADSGASDSGVGSNISQNSLPTVTPPSSPGLILTNPLAYDLNMAISNGQVEDKLLLSGQATQPASVLFKSSSSSCSTCAPNNCVPHMIRSRSHESNLPKKIVRGKPAPINPLVDSGAVMRKAGVYLNSIVSGGVGASKGVDLGSYAKSKSSCLLTSFHNSNGATGSDPAGSSAAVSPDSGCESCSTSTYAPRSPRGNVRMLHNINHRFVRMWKPSMSQCHVCSRPLGLTGERCSDCKMKIHSVCKEKIGPTCGLTARRMRQIYELLVLGNEEGSWDVSSEEKRSPQPAQSGKIPASVSNSYLNAYPDRFDSASSSSCNSSAPSTPAPAVAAFVHSPGVSIQHRPKFSFTDVMPEVPVINIELQNGVAESRDSEENGSAGSTLVMSRDGSFAGTGSEQTLSPDENLIDSLGSNDSTFGGHQWRRDVWSAGTIRGGSASWREWTIPIEEVRFKKDSLIGRGRFGEVHAAYWHQDVAVKLLNMDHVEDEKQLEMFKVEVSTFRSTRHENLILFMGCCLKPPRLGIVMNLCKGRTLHTILHARKERWDLSRFVNVAAQVCQGMSYLHGKKIIHKDLRTKNIFIENNSKVVITDFGLFSIHRLLRSQNHADCKFLSVPEHWLAYLAPEVMRSLLKYKENGDGVEELPFSGPSDVYSFGTVWFELLAGDFPFKRYAPETIIWQVGRGIKPALNNLQVPKETKEICMSCWAFRLGDRPSFNTLLKVFEKLPRKRLERSPSYPSSHVSRSAESLF